MAQPATKRDKDQRQPVSVCAYPSAKRRGENLVGSVPRILPARTRSRKRSLPLSWFYRRGRQRTATAAHRDLRDHVPPDRGAGVRPERPGRCSTCWRMCTSSSNCTISAARRSRWTTGGSAAVSTTPSRRGRRSRAATFLIVAKDPKRLAAIKEYRLAGITVLGPYEGVLSNNGERVSVENDGGNAEDTVRYSAQFPWPIGADSIGAGTEVDRHRPDAVPISRDDRLRASQLFPAGRRSGQLGRFAAREKRHAGPAETTSRANARCRRPSSPPPAQSTARATS